MATIQRLPSGKYRVQVRRSGVYKAQTFARKADAAAWAAQLEQSIERGTAIGKVDAPKTMTVADVFFAYVDETDASTATRSTARKVSRVLGDLPIRSLNAYHVQRFVDARLKEASGPTVARDLADLSSCLKWARHARHLDIDDTVAADARRGLRVAKIRTSSRQRDRIFSDEEMARILAQADAAKTTIPYRDLIELAATSALRLGEICGLRWDDYDGRTILVRARKHPDAAVKEENHQRVALTLAGRAVIDRQPRRGDRIFPFAPNSVSSGFGVLTRRANVPDAHFHDLRHMAITGLFRRGLDIPHVSAISGHRSWKELKRYAQISADDVLARLGEE